MRVIYILLYILCSAVVHAQSKEALGLKFVQPGKDLIIFPDSTFEYNSYGNGFTKTKGGWRRSNDTLVLTFSRSWIEAPWSANESQNPNSKEIEVTFQMEDKKPIVNMPGRYSCSGSQTGVSFVTDSLGQARFSGRALDLDTTETNTWALPKRVLFFNLDKYNADKSLFIQNISNKILVTIIRNPKSGQSIKTKKFLFRKRDLVDIDDDGNVEPRGEFKMVR